MKYLFPVLFLFIGFRKTTGQNAAKSDKPLFTSKETSRVSIDSNYYYQFTAKDSAGNPLSYSVKNLPSWLIYNHADHSISGKAVKAGQYYIRIFVSNGKDKARQQYMLTVFDHQTTNILCLGNSITNGTDKYNSYRRALWQLLHQSNYDFDFIGSWSRHHMGGEVPDPDFDMDHEGHSGWTYDNFFNPPAWDSARGNINAWLQTYTPGIVLLELGTNDVFQCAPVADIIKSLSRVVEVLRSKNNNVKIFLAQILPLGKKWAPQKLCGNDHTYAQALNDLNQKIAAFAAENSTKLSPVIVVDQFSGIDTDTDMYDDIHPNESGEKIMAERWFAAIHTHLEKLK